MADFINGAREVRQERKRWAARDSTSPIEGSNIDLLRLLEYPQLLGKTYLDHAGTTPWAKSLTNEFAQMMTEDLYGNPHSESAPSKLSDAKIEATRVKALQFFNADPEHFDLIFTHNASGAIKLVHDCFRDHGIETCRNWWYGYHRDAHTSLVGVREGTRMHRCFRNDKEVDLWIESRGLGGAAPHDIGLFAYPGQSNMTGRRLPLSWCAGVRKRVKGEVYTLLDAAALASTGHIDLSNPATAPDFMAVSFYKIFGFPNLGALIVRKASAGILMSRKYFAGGTVEMVIAVNHSWVSKKVTIHSRLEDGTLPFTSIFALDLAIDTHRKLYGPAPMKYISMHTSRLIKKLYDQMVSLKHSNGVPVIQIYKEKSAIYGESHLQGAAIAFNIQKPTGGLVSFMDVEKEANKQCIYIRSGSLCNPGGMAHHLNWSPKELREAYDEGHRCSEPLAEVFGKAIGVVRVSLGAMSNDDDVDRLVAFIKERYVDAKDVGKGAHIAIPELMRPASTTTTTTTTTTTKDLNGCILQVSEEPRTPAAFPPIPQRVQSVGAGTLMPPPTTQDRSDSQSVREKKTTMSMKSLSSLARIRRVRRSIMGVLSLSKNSGKDTLRDACG